MSRFKTYSPNTTHDYQPIMVNDADGKWYNKYEVDKDIESIIETRVHKIEKDYENYKELVKKEQQKTTDKRLAELEKMSNDFIELKTKSIQEHSDKELAKIVKKLFDSNANSEVIKLKKYVEECQRLLATIHDLTTPSKDEDSEIGNGEAYDRE